MLQCRVGKRTGKAALKMAMDMLKENLIDKKTAIMRLPPLQIIEMLLPIINPTVEAKVKPLCTGLPAGPGCSTGQIVLSSADAVEKVGGGKEK